MVIREVRWHTYSIPFRSPFRTSATVRSIREGAIVELVTSEGIVGLGEIAPLAEFGHGTLAAALAALTDIARRLVGQRVESQDDLGAYLNYLNSLPACPAPTLCGVDVALHDAYAQLEGVPLAVLLADGTPRSRVDVNAVLGAEATDATVAAALSAVHDGFGCLKLKIDVLGVASREHNGAERAVQQEVARIQAVREAVGRCIVLRLDANGALTRPLAERLLYQCAGLDIEYIEQPLPAGDVDGLSQLRQHSPIAIALDESVTHAAAARTLLDRQAGAVLVLKLQSLGGLHACREVIALAERYRVRCTVTTSLEAGIGVAAALHLAGAADTVLPHAGLATLPLLTDHLLCHPLVLERGSMEVPARPGLGITLRHETLTVFENVVRK